MGSDSPRPGHYLSRSLRDEGEALFVPGHFQFRDEAQMLSLVAAYPLAQLFTAEQGRHRVTASPMVALPQRDAQGALQFIGHMAGRNPQVSAIQAGAQATAVFSGPGAYVSPQWFRVTHTAPTWNYRAVQAHGRLEAITDPEGVREVLRRTIDHVEQGAHPDPGATRWTLEDLPRERADFLLDKVSAFRLVITHLEGVNRLNQDKHLDDILGIMAALASSPQPQGAAVAGAMAAELAGALPLPVSV